MSTESKKLSDAEIRASMTSEQILLERKLTCESIDGAIAFGYQNTNVPRDGHWLAPFWKIGRQQAELEAQAAATQATALQGWKLVPIEPTTEMVIDGFESCPSATFSPQKEWETFEAMSGCQQAAHKARLCYAAMLAVAPVAPAAPINLEGLRKKLLTPREIVRDENGWLSHPDYPICDEGTNADAFLGAFGIETWFRSMESDMPDFAERYQQQGLSNCAEWTPTPPDGDGWVLLEIYDTEDGPYALFARDQYEAENALKRMRTRELSERIQQRQANQGDAQ